ncbi:MAG TPA: phosphotransferase [Chloroflexota bacterium]
MRLPDLVAYQAAIQHPSTAFADPHLRAASVTTGRLGLPRAVAGNFAVTYQLRDGSRQWAVRCFHREAADRGSRYAAISQHLARLRAGPLVPIEYLDRGVCVGQTWYPITKMAWLDGRPLNHAVEQSLSSPNALADIERRFIQLVAELRRLGIAHGDLQHGNVLVDGSGTLRLVDYDGMFVPALRGRPASESGDPNYQHPGRALQFDAELDRFAAIVIVLALRALEAAPRLWQTYNTGDNLLFRRADFANSAASPLLRDLAGLTSMRELSQRFATICHAPYARVPTLDEFVGGLGSTMSARHVAVLNTLYASARNSRATGILMSASVRPGASREASRGTGKASRGSQKASRGTQKASRERHNPRFQANHPTTRPRDASASTSGARSWKLRRASVQTSLAFSPDGQVLASGDPDGRITLRESATGRTQRSVRLPRLPHSAGTLRALAFTPSGDLLAVTADGPNLCVWHVARQQQRLRCTLGGRAVRSVALSSNATWLAAAGDDGTVCCWKLADGRPRASFAAHASVMAVAVSRDGHLIAAAGPRVPLTVWDARGGQVAADLPSGPSGRSGHSGRSGRPGRPGRSGRPGRPGRPAQGVTSLAFAADGARLAIGTLSGQLLLRQLRPAVHLPELAPLSGPVEAVALSPDGLTAAATTRDGSIWLRRLPAPPPRSSVRAPALAFQPLTATRVISSSYRLFDWLRRVALL